MTAADSDRLANVEAVVRVYRAKLDVAVRANRDDPRFCTGATHALTAMDRLARALAGETDPVRLGIADPETTQPAAGEPAGLFDAEGVA